MKNRIITRIFITLPCVMAIFIAAITQSPALAYGEQPKVKRSTNFLLKIDGYTLGTTTRTWTSATPETTLFSNHETIDAYGIDYKLTSQLEWNKRDLTSFVINEDDDGFRTSLTGTLANGKYDLFRTEKDKRTQLDSLEKPNFDTTFQGLPLFLATSGYPQHPAELRILDTDSGTVKKATVRHTSDETLNLAGRKFQCKKIDFNMKGVKATLWITSDGLGDFVVKETSESEIGKAELTLTEYSPVFHKK